jgi:hypothetical protein
MLFEKMVTEFVRLSRQRARGESGPPCSTHTRRAYFHTCLPWTCMSITCLCASTSGVSGCGLGVACLLNPPLINTTHPELNHTIDELNHEVLRWQVGA